MKLCCFVIIVFIPLFVFSQPANDYKKSQKAIENCPTYIIQMPAAASQLSIAKTKLPVGKIEVQDVREDTGSIGIQLRLYASGSNHKCRKILFNQPLSSAFSGYLNKSTNFPVSVSPYVLLCFIKEFRITQRDSINNYNQTKALYNRLALKVETFLKQGDNYFPAFKIDTTVLELVDNIHELDMIPDVLTGVLKKCAGMSVENTEAKHAYTLPALEDHYSKALEKPILRAPIKEAGIYMSFEEFINNKPSITSYKVKADKLSASLYSVLPDGEEVLQTKAFGYCDGTVIWLNMANHYYPLICRQNTFEYIGNYHAIGKQNENLSNYYLDVSNSVNLASSAASAGLTSLAVGYLNAISTLRGQVIHQLNLETGEIY